MADPGEYGSFTYSWTVTGGGVSSTSGNTSATFNFTPTSDANYAVSLTVTDADGKTASADVTIYRGGSGGSGGCSPVGLGGGLRNGPDSPTVTIQECNSQGNPNPSPVLAGSAAYFLVSVGGNEPNHGTVTLSDDTQNGSDDANSDYTGTVGTLTFSFNSSLNGGHGGYAPQMITVNTSPTADSGNFSMDIPCLYDPYASIPGSSSPPSNQSPPVASATAYITAPACSVSLTIPQSENTNPLVNVGSSMSGSTLTGYATQLEAVQVTVSIQGNDFVPGQYAVQLDGGGAEIFSDPQGNDQISGFFIESPSDLTRTVYVEATVGGSYQITANLLDASQPPGSPFVATDSLITRFQQLVGQIGDATNSAINSLLSNPKTRSFIIDKIAGQLKSIFSQVSDQIGDELRPGNKFNFDAQETGGADGAPGEPQSLRGAVCEPNCLSRPEHAQGERQRRCAEQHPARGEVYRSLGVELQTQHAGAGPGPQSNPEAHVLDQLFEPECVEGEADRYNPKHVPCRD